MGILFYGKQIFRNIFKMNGAEGLVKIFLVFDSRYLGVVEKKINNIPTE
jgi:hypothetical protein